MPIYYGVCKAVILLCNEVLQKETFQRRETEGKVERVLFSGDVKSFFVCMGIFLLCALPYLVNFCPGTMEDDAYIQLCEYFGAREMTGHHPVLVTKIMGKFINFGKTVLHSDSKGLFLYIGLQFIGQILAFCYTLNVLSRLKTPIILRWFALTFYALFPIFPMWGCTLSKDTGYYIFMLFFVAVLTDIFAFSADRVEWWKIGLLLCSSLGISLFRNNGRYVVVITTLSIILLYKKHIKVFLAALLLCLLSIFCMEEIYMPLNNVKEGPVKEMLSIPLQQTARYIREYYEDITEDEAVILEAVFEEELEVIGEEYAPEFADPVKDLFVKYPEDGMLKQYFKVWFQQFWRHPDVYIDAFLNHIYGYFYIGRECFQDPMAVFSYVNNSQHWSDENMELEFFKEEDSGRLFLEELFWTLSELPIIKIFFRMSAYTFCLLGLCVRLLERNTKRQIIVFIPALCSLLICLVSPVGTCLRYMLPIIVLLPVHIAWSDFIGKNVMKNENK